MPFALEKHGDKAIVTNTKTGKHYSNEPITIQNAKSQMTILQNNTKYMKELRKKKTPKMDKEDLPRSF
jgi:hypothetical protein